MGALVSALLRSLRPWQWVKNVAVLLPAIFARRLGDSPALLGALAAAAAFCAASSANYLWNDVLDRERDRRHSTKRQRPIASGQLPVARAVWAARFLVVIAFAIVWFAPSADPRAELGFLAGYLALGMLYSAFLKRVPVLDVVVIGGGFLLRVLAGGAAAGVPVSHWLITCATLVAVFLGFGKRAAEVARLDPGAVLPRARYSPRLARASAWIAGAALVVAYTAYTVAPRTVHEFGSRRLLITAPIALCGVLRAAWAFTHSADGEDPSRLLIRDRWLRLAALAWLAAIAALITPWRST